MSVKDIRVALNASKRDLKKLISRGYPELVINQHKVQIMNLEKALKGENYDPVIPATSTSSKTQIVINPNDQRSD